MHDALGITGVIRQNSVKLLAHSAGDIRAAIKLYIEEVEGGIYPAEEHTFQ